VVYVITNHEKHLVLKLLTHTQFFGSFEFVQHNQSGLVQTWPLTYFLYWLQTSLRSVQTSLGLALFNLDVFLLWLAKGQPKLVQADVARWFNDRLNSFLPVVQTTLNYSVGKSALHFNLIVTFLVTSSPTSCPLSTLQKNS
jgi:hypothetical protein